MSRSTQQGFSLVELMVALAIGSFLIVGAVYVYSQSRNTYTVNETVARLQENGRYVLSLIEPDLQSAGYFGYSNIPDNFQFVTLGSLASPRPASQMQQTDPAVPGLPVSAQVCGTNFAVDLYAAVQGTNNAYNFPAACAANGGGAFVAAIAPSPDTLTVRHLTRGATVAAPGRIQAITSRATPNNQYIFTDGTPPGVALSPGHIELRDLIVRTYYISRDSRNRPGLPALRVKSLVRVGGAPAFAGVDTDTGIDADTEVMPGVEDLQVQFGIDTGDYNGDGVIDPGLDLVGAPGGGPDGIPDSPNGTATRYVNPGAVPAGLQVVSVRIWLRLRAEQPEQGFRDTRPYQYAGVNLTPNDNIRRVLVSRTIQLRNTRSL